MILSLLLYLNILTSYWRSLLSMFLKYIKKFYFIVLLLSILLVIPSPPIKANNSIEFILLSQYKATVDIEEEFYLIAITSNAKLPTFKSSDSRIVSVNTYGKVTPKKAGTATITAKISGAEASCRVTVNKTIITLNKKSCSIERGEQLKLSASTSNNTKVTWKSSKKSVATIDDYGMVTAIKPGESTITATANGTSSTCIVKVKSPTLTINKTKVTLYRGKTESLTATVSSGFNPKWKTNKSSVATVDEYGTITAIKNGIATITATIDGVSKTCEVIVEKPTIKLNQTEFTIKKGQTNALVATVSSGNNPIWSTSNSKIAIVDSKGLITGLEKGRAYIYASEDGTKMKCTVYVTE